jgi:hypothetical protein
MTQATSAGAALGPALSHHAYTPAAKASAFLWAAVFIAVPSYAIVNWLRHAASIGPVVVMSLAPGAFVAMGVWMLFGAIQDAGLALDVHEQGIALTRGGMTKPYPWATLRTVTEKKMKGTGAVVRVVLAFQDGTKVTVDRKIGDFEQLRTLLRR